MKIAIDIDGTVAHFVQAFSEVALKHYGITTDWTQGDMGINRKQFLEIYDFMIDTDAFYDVPVYEPERSILRKWHEEGHEIFYVTRRRPGKRGDTQREYYHQRQTMCWLITKHFCNVAGHVVFVQDKGKWCVEHGVSILIEDYLKDAENWDGLFIPATAEHLKVYLITRPWNQGDYHRRIESFEEVELVKATI